LRGYTKEGVPDAIRKAGGEIFAVTSEPQTLAREARASWQLDFEPIGDPHHEVADACRERGWLDLIVNPRVDFLKRMRTWASHPKGYFQPGVLAISRTGRVLYRWRGVPTRQNAGGATSRPEAEHVWHSIERALAQQADAADAALDSPPSIDWKAPPWPLFVALLLANGNFIRPRGFGLTRGGPNDTQGRFARAMAKGAIFAGAWVAASILLPGVWVAAAFALWALAVTPGIVIMHREFQNIPQNS